MVLLEIKESMQYVFFPLQAKIPVTQLPMEVAAICACWMLMVVRAHALQVLSFLPDNKTCEQGKHQLLFFSKKAR